MLSSEESDKLFTPSPEMQTMRILKNQCPHNQGWSWDGHGHSDNCYKCNLCHVTKWH